MNRRHVHFCFRCGDSLYTCHEAGNPDNGCANARPGEREYCPDCCVQLEDDVNDAMHNDDATAAQQWHEGR